MFTAKIINSAGELKKISILMTMVWLWFQFDRWRGPRKLGEVREPGWSWRFDHKIFFIFKTNKTIIAFLSAMYITNLIQNTFSCCVWLKELMNFDLLVYISIPHVFNDLHFVIWFYCWQWYSYIRLFCQFQVHDIWKEIKLLFFIIFQWHHLELLCQNGLSMTKTQYG